MRLSKHLGSLLTSPLDFLTQVDAICSSSDDETHQKQWASDPLLAQVGHCYCFAFSSKVLKDTLGKVETFQEWVLEAPPHSALAKTYIS
jgi:hypothetical protein